MYTLEMNVRHTSMVNDKTQHVGQGTEKDVSTGKTYSVKDNTFMNFSILTIAMKTTKIE